MRQDPTAKLDYDWDWQPDVKTGRWKPALAVGETITSATITSTPAGLTVSAPTHTDTTVKVLVSGGLGRYRLTCHVVTSAGREDSQTMVLDVEPT